MTMTAGAAWLNETFSIFDEAITLTVHNLHQSCGTWMKPIMEIISLMGKGGIFLILLSLILLLFLPTRRFGTAMALGLAIGAVAVNLWLKVMIARPRPYADINSIYYPLWQALGSHVESDFSFPSGHAAFASMVPVFLLGNKKWSWLALVFAFLMGISRIYLVVHFPSDVLGGIITGTIAGLIGTLIVKLIPSSSGWYSWNLFKKRPKGAHE